MHEHGKIGPHVRRAGAAAHHRLDRPRRLRVGRHAVRVHPDDLKEVVYTMRFDRASAIYAEFGRFYAGMVAPIDELVARLNLG